MFTFSQDEAEMEFSNQRPYCFSIFLIALAGLFTSAYLAVSHYRNYMDIGYQSFCAISRSLNCDTVSQSPYAVFLGVPLGIWGIVGYLVFLFFALLLFPGKNEKTLQSWAGGLFVLSGIFSVASLILAGITTFAIHSYCLMCIVLYGINFILLYLSWMIWKRAGKDAASGRLDRLKTNILFFKTKIGRIALVGTGFLIVSGTLVLFYPKYWQFPEIAVNAATHSGITEDGSPWIGALHPVLTIEEYTDYMCFQCGKMHSHLRQLVNRYPDRIRLVHRHFPLDDKINPVVKEKVHPNSGLISLFAIAAEDAGVFWQVNDLLFRDAREKEVINFNEIGKEAGFDTRQINKEIYNKKNIARLKMDIRSGLKAGITATPSYVIDGKVYAGTIPDSVLRSAFP